MTLREALAKIGLPVPAYPLVDDRQYRVVTATCASCAQPQNLVVPLEDVSLCIFCSATLPEKGQQRT